MSSSPNDQSQSGVRFSIAHEGIGYVSALVSGATKRRRYLELTGDGLVARYGWLLHHRFPVADIEEAALLSTAGPVGVGWSLFGAGGWYGVTVYSKRGGGPGVVGLAFAKSGLVGVRIKKPVRVRIMGLPMSCGTLVASLDGPVAFLEALAQLGVPTTKETGGQAGAS